MAATVSVLRKIQFDVCPPKILVDRKTERPLLPPEIAQDKVMMVTTKEEAFRFASEIKEYMEAQADEVYPNLFIGNYKAVNTLKLLKDLGITHIFNTAEGFGDIMVPPLSPEQLDGIEYSSMPILDDVKADDGGAQVKNFLEAADIIHQMMQKEDNSRVLVNCFSGFSRSASTVITYLICYKGMTAGEALRTIKLKRDVWPNNENLAHVARISNEKHGFVVDNVVDV